jgi:hypothetical protein
MGCMIISISVGFYSRPIALQTTRNMDEMVVQIHSMMYQSDQVARIIVTHGSYWRRPGLQPTDGDDDEFMLGDHTRSSDGPQ